MAIPQYLNGAQCADQYKDIKFLAHGGMGATIYTALDTVSNETVVAKVIHIENQILESLLEEEFKIAVKLAHQNIVSTYYYARFKDETGEYFYSIMEYCPSGSLEELLISSTEFISLQRALQFFKDLLAGLTEAHKYIVHRDLKPKNILLGKNGELKICDFGISKYVLEKTRTKTLKGWGTEPYMSPEGWKADANTTQMDIYSLGIIFFQILSLQKPYVGPRTTDFQNQHLFEPLPDLRLLRQEIPIPLIELVRKMTAKSINERFKTSLEISEKIEVLNSSSTATHLNLQHLLSNSNERTKQINQEELEKQRKAEEVRLHNRLLDTSITSLFDHLRRLLSILIIL